MPRKRRRPRNVSRETPRKKRRIIRSRRTRRRLARRARRPVQRRRRRERRRPGRARRSVQRRRLKRRKFKLPKLRLIPGSVRDRRRIEALKKIGRVPLGKLKRAPRKLARLSSEVAQDIGRVKAQGAGRYAHAKGRNYAAIAHVRVVALEAGDSPGVAGKVFAYHFKFKLDGVGKDEALSQVRSRLGNYQDNVQAWGFVSSVRVNFVSRETLARVRRKP